MLLQIQTIRLATPLIVAANLFFFVSAEAATVGSALDTPPPGFEPRSAPERLLLTPTGLDDGAAIEVPQFDEEDIEFTLDGKLTEPVWAKVPGYASHAVL